jgi:hypothetical protein
MENEQIIYFQALDMGWVVSAHMLKQIGAGHFSLRHLGEVSLNPQGRTGRDTKAKPPPP